MGCYLGCATKRNKVMWCLFALLLLLGGILIAVGLSRVPACRRGLPQQCYAGGSSGRYVEMVDESCRVSFASCIRPWLIMAGIGCVGLASALVVTCAMCCCNKPPKAAHQQLPSGGVQMTAAPINPYQQQQQHLPAHHPYAAGAPYGHQQQQQPSGGYPPYPQQKQQQQQQPWQAQQPQQQPWQQQQQQGTPFTSQQPFLPQGSYQQQQQQQQQQPLSPYPTGGNTGSSNVPVQQF